jgi:hypothetical protein
MVTCTVQQKSITITDTTDVTRPDETRYVLFQKAIAPSFWTMRSWYIYNLPAFMIEFSPSLQVSKPVP